MFMMSEEVKDLIGSLDERVSALEERVALIEAKLSKLLSSPEQTRPLAAPSSNGDRFEEYRRVVEAIVSIIREEDIGDPALRAFLRALKAKYGPNVLVRDALSAAYEAMQAAGGGPKRPTPTNASKGNGGEPKILSRIRKEEVVLLSEVKGIRRKEAFLRWLEKNGFLVIRGAKDCAILTRQFWQKFVRALPAETAKPSDVRRMTYDPMYRLMNFLMEEGLIFHGRDGWQFVEPPERIAKA